MKFVTLKTLDKKKILITTLIVTSLILVITIFVSHAEFTSTDHVTIVDGVINYIPYDFKMMAMYQQKENCEDTSDDACYSEVDTMPSEGYEINEEKSYCFVDDDNEKIKDKLYTNSDGEHVIKELPKRSKCIIYFEKRTTKKVSTVLGELAVHLDAPDLSKTACDSGCGTTESGIYEAQDNYGTSYYYRGTVNNNWVQFGGYWWRIIRINGNGTVRMIYSGTVESGDQPAEDGYLTPSDNSQLSSTSAFNSAVGDNTYVGWRTGTEGASSYTAAHSNSKNSTILDAIIKWYNTDSTLSSADKLKIDGATGFCNDRIPYQYDELTLTSKPDSSLYGYEATATRYGAYFRRSQTHQPTYDCQKNDLFTTEGNNGNGVGQVPVGLITIDEVMYAGGQSSTNYGYWLYTGSTYWTISPSYFNGNYAYMSALNSSGSLGSDYVRSPYGVRPMINLKATITYSGAGTVSNPYIPS